MLPNIVLSFNPPPSFIDNQLDVSSRSSIVIITPRHRQSLSHRCSLCSDLSGHPACDIILIIYLPGTFWAGLDPCPWVPRPYGATTNSICVPGQHRGKFAVWDHFLLRPLRQHSRYVHLPLSIANRLAMYSGQHAVYNIVNSGGPAM